jgi:hypothetical protein
MIALVMAVPLACGPVAAQSNHAETLLAGGAWHLHSRIPLGSDALLLQPAHQVVDMLVSAESPEFEGWRLQAENKTPVLLNVSGKPVRNLPGSINFRITVGTRDKLADANPMPVESSKNLNDFLLDFHFHAQVFRGMDMREVQPTKVTMIGVPAEEVSDERIYHVSFNFGEVRPDERIVLLLLDGSGHRLGKFHLEFL